MKRRVLDRLLLSARVHAVQQRAPRLNHITLTGQAIAGLTFLPGHHVRVQVSAAPGAIDWLVGTLRTYSVWDYDGENLELIVFDHGDGPGATWGRTAQPGDEVMLLKPQGTFTSDSAAAYHLFVGEETSQVSFGPMVRALPAGSKTFGAMEVESPEERLEPGPSLAELDFRWTYRGDRSAASASTLVDAVGTLDLPAEPGIAYLAGEARTIQAVRTHLVEERGWPRRNVRTKPFWAPGKKGLD